MRTIFLFMNISLDGYVSDENQDISGFHNDYEAFSSEESQNVDTLLLGHTTYEMMKFWATPQGQELHPEIAQFMTATPKLVVSHASFEPGWQNVSIICDDVLASIERIKHQSGKNIMVMGSNTLVVSLMEAGLIDKFQIIVNPVAFGGGMSLFAGLSHKVELQLTDTQSFKSGAVMHTYVLAT